VRLGVGNGTFGTATEYSSDVGYGTGISFAPRLGDLNGDGILDLVTANFAGYGVGSAVVRLGQDNGTFGLATEYLTEGSASYSLTLGDINGDGNLDLITAGTSGSAGQTTIRLGRGDGTFGSASQYTQESNETWGVALGDLNGDGVPDLVTVGNSSAPDGFATIRLGTTINGTSPILSFDLSTLADARQSIGILDRKLDSLNSQRGVIGAMQSRLHSAYRTLDARAENYALAESQIRNADIAAEAGQLVRNSVLSQAAAAVLAQANQNPALALALLKS